MTKYVVSDTLSDPEWNNSHVIAGSDVVAEVAKLREQPGGNILVNGSVQLVETLLENDLVDELRLMVYPTVLGQGKRLFDETSEPKSLKLVSSKPAGETLILVYEPASS
jgi:dihydrofolate reductase